MKNFYNNTNLYQKSSRFIFFLDGDFSEKESQDAESLIESNDADLLQNFSLKNIKELRQQPEILNEPKHKKKFQSLVEHQLLITENSKEDINKNFPPRILFALKTSTNLYKFLTPDQRKRLEKIFDQNRNDVIQASKQNSEKWTLSTTLQACAFYDDLKKQKKLTPQDKTLYNDLREKLLKKGIILLTRYRLQEQYDIRQNKLFDSESDRLLLLEIFRVHPKAADWIVDMPIKKEEQSQLPSLKENDVLNIFESLANNISHNIFSNKNNPDTILFWETLQALDHDPETTIFNLTDSQRNVLRERIKRMNSIRFLLAKDGQKSLTVAQFSLLKKLKSQRFLDVEDKFQRFRKDDPTEDEEKKYKLNDLEEEKKQKEKVLSDLQDKQIDEILQDFDNATQNLDEDKKDELTNLKENFEEAKNNFENVTDNPKEKFEKFVEDLYTNFDADLTYGESFKTYFKWLKIEDFDSTKNSNLRKKFNEIATAIGTDPKADLLKSFEEIGSDFLYEKDKYEKSKQNFSDAIENIRGKSGYSKDIKDTKDDIKKIKEELREVHQEDMSIETLKDYLDNTNEKADEFYDKFVVDIQYRANRNQLLGSDLTIFYKTLDSDPGILENQEFAKNILGEAKFDAIRDFRLTFFGEILGPSVNQIDSDLSGTDGDWQQTWLNVIDQNIGRTSLLRKIREHGTLNIEEIFGSEQNPNEIIDGLVLEFKDRIFSIVERKLDDHSVSEEDKQNFWGKLYASNRLHLGIRSNNEISAIDRDQQKYNADRSYEDYVLQDQYQKINSFVDQVVGEYDEALKILEASGQKLSDKGPEFWKKYQDFFVQFFLQNLDKDDDVFRQEIINFFQTELGLDISGENKILQNFLTRKKILEIYDTKKSWLQNGQEVLDENGEKVFVPGSDQMRAIELKSSSIVREIQDSLDNFVGEMSYIQSQLTKIEEKFSKGEIDETEKRFQRKALIPKIEKIFNNWDSSTINISGNIETVQEIFYGILGEDEDGNDNFDKGFRKYFDDIKKAWGRLNENFQTFRNNFDPIKFEKAEDEECDFYSGIFTKFPKDLNEFGNLLDFKKGFWNRERGKNLEYFANQEATWKHLHSFGMFDEDGKDEEGFNLKKAREGFEEKRKIFNAQYQEYKTSVETVLSTIRGDLKSPPIGYNDQDFQKKYGTTKESIQENVINKLEVSNQELDQIWNNFNASPDDPNYFWNNFETKWKAGKTDPSKRAEAMNEFKNWDDICNNIEPIKNQTQAYWDWLNNYNEAAEQDGRRKWLNFSWSKGNRVIHKIRFAGLFEIYKIVKQVIESRERVWNRNVDKRVGRLGQDIFGDSKVGKEFRRMLEKSEEERVNEFKTQYSDQESYVAQKALRSSRDQDEIKGIMQLLNERGVLRWDDPDLWRAFMRLDSSVYFDIDADMNLQPDAIRAKVRDAITTIWSQETFRAIDTSMDSNIKKQKETYETEFMTDWSDKQLQLVDHLSSILNRWEKGETNSEHFNPARYEAFLEQMIIKGKRKLREKMYFLIKGVTTRNPYGKTLLSRNTLKRIANDNIKRYPQLEYLVDFEISSYKYKGKCYTEEEVRDLGIPAEKRQWNMQDYEIWADMIDEKDGSNKPKIGGKMDDFIHRYVETSHFVLSRAERVQPEASMTTIGADDAEERFFGMTMNTILDWGTKKSGGEDKFSADHWRGFLRGANQFFLRRYKWVKDGDMENGDDPWWQRKRKQILLEVAKKMPVAELIVQQLKNNYGAKQGNSQTTFFDSTQWSTESRYGIDPMFEKNKIDNFVQNVVFDVNGYDSKYKVLLENDNTAVAQKDPRIGKYNKMNYDFLFNKNTFDKYFASDLDTVWKALDDNYKDYPFP